MTFYGHGALRYPGTKRVIHDFEDGPFSTVNPDLVRHALAMGFSTEPLADPEPERRKPGRPPKEKRDVEKQSAAEVSSRDESRTSGRVRREDTEGKETAREEKEGK